MVACSHIFMSMEKQLDKGWPSRGLYRGESVQEMLLRKGLARVAFVYPPNDSYVTRFKEIEAEARENKCGIWSLEGYAHSRGFNTDRYPYDEKSKKDIQKVCD